MEKRDGTNIKEIIHFCRFA